MKGMDTGPSGIVRAPTNSLFPIRRLLLLRLAQQLGLLTHTSPSWGRSTLSDGGCGHLLESIEKKEGVG